jgi:hypothetical protein
MGIKWKDFAKRNLVSSAKDKSEQPSVNSAIGAAIPIEATQNRALSVRQPYAEQIMQGTKTIEYRSFRTNIRGRVYIHASLTPGPDGEFRKLGATVEDFEKGVIIGTVEIIDCTGVPEDYEWHLARPIRLDQTIKPEKHPQPVWFIPFKK